MLQLVDKDGIKEASLELGASAIAIIVFVSIIRAEQMDISPAASGATKRQLPRARMI